MKGELFANVIENIISGLGDGLKNEDVGRLWHINQL
jgi:hypothetical protein